MIIQHTETPPHGSWFVEENGRLLAELKYIIRDNEVYSLNSTRVDDELRGKNVGKQLVEAAVTFAREHHIRLLPMCPFVVALFEKIPEYGDVHA